MTLDVDTIAQIITGEAEVLGVVGMTTVAGCIATQIAHGWTPERICQSWTARKAASDTASYLAAQVIDGEVIPNGFECCLSLADTLRLNCGNGEIVVALRGTPFELHLWKIYPGSRKRVTVEPQISDEERAAYGDYGKAYAEAMAIMQEEEEGAE